MMYTLRCRSSVPHGPQGQCAQQLLCFADSEQDAYEKFLHAARALDANLVTGVYMCPVHTAEAVTGEPWDGRWLPLDRGRL